TSRRMLSMPLEIELPHVTNPKPAMRNAPTVDGLIFFSSTQPFSTSTATPLVVQRRRKIAQVLLRDGLIDSRSARGVVNRIRTDDRGEHEGFPVVGHFFEAAAADAGVPAHA